MTAFRALTTAVSIDIAEEVAHADVVRALVQCYPSAACGELHYRLTRTTVWRDEHPLHVNAPDDVVPVFEMDLYEQVVQRAAPGWLLHAAALDVGSEALVLCGPSGAGKTTLTLALAESFRVVTEEIVRIDSDGAVTGLARPIHADVRHDARAPRHWQRVSYPIRAPAGHVLENLLLLPPRDAFQHAPLPLRGIVRIGHGPDWPTHLHPAEPSVALARLWDRSMRHDHAGLAIAVDVLRRHPSFELSSTTVADAVAALAPLLKGLI